MSSDASSKEQPDPRAKLWALPDIVKVTAVQVRFKTPLIRYEGQEKIQHDEAVEFMVETAAPIPERALSPVLMIGDVPVAEYEAAGPNLYRFYGFEPKALREGAEVSLQWPERRTKQERAPITFELKGEEQR